MKPLSGKELLLERQGWQLRRVHGSHHIYGRDGDTVVLSVPVHGSQPLKRGLQAHLAKLAGLRTSESE